MSGEEWTARKTGRHERPPCGDSCPGDCGWDPNDPKDPCAAPDVEWWAIDGQSDPFGEP